MSNSKTMTLTEGPIWLKLVTFAIPIFMGQLFQQLYNTADSLIVGNFLGAKALAAVGSSGNLIFLLVGFFQGISIGAGVVIARYFGARDRAKLRRSIHTTLIFGVVCGFGLMAVGVLCVPKILEMMHTPPDVMPNSIEYFRIYFYGSIAFVMYNFCCGILQAVGDSRHPLYYLIFSSVLNIVLDLVFIGVFDMGVGAAALATIISQAASAVLCLIQLRFIAPEEYRISLAELRPDFAILGEVVRNGVPTGVQNSVISIANVFVQANINVFGSIAMAGCGSYSKVEGFGFLPVMSISNALTTFISQNIGAGKYDRVKKSGYLGVVSGVIIAELIGICLCTFSPYMISWFNRDPEIIAFGVAESHIMGPLFFMCAFSHLVSGVLRGAGKSAVPMYIMLCIWCGIRMAYISLIMHFIPSIRAVFFTYPLTWFLSSCIFMYYLLKTDWVHGYR